LWHKILDLFSSAHGAQIELTRMSDVGREETVFF